MTVEFAKVTVHSVPSMVTTLSLWVSLNPEPCIVSVVPPPVPPRDGVTEAIWEVNATL